MGTLIRNARILTMDDDLKQIDRADILIRGSKIESIGTDLAIPEDEPDLTIINGDGKLAMPGLVNAHVHTPGNFVRGSLDNLTLEIFMLYEVPPITDTTARTTCAQCWVRWRCLSWVSPQSRMMHFMFRYPLQKQLMV